MLNERIARTSSSEPEKILNEPKQYHNFVCEDGNLGMSIQELNLGKYYTGFKK